MAKVYQFPSKGASVAKPTPIKSEVELQLRSTMNLLIATYKESHKGLEDIKKEIKEMDGTHFKNGKEVLKQIKAMNKKFLKYGVSVGGYKFLTFEETEVIYVNANQLFYIGKTEADKKSYTTGNFIDQYNTYKFTLILDESLYHIIDERMQELSITIKTLENTKI
ncbi:MAG: hypothetical protein RR448_08370 [Niameybacter sp.]|uniref:hypothetical protein n=1 Tax=Niameybacter sp. TaxID=2033640 RepID=UPI002FCA3CE9